MDLGFLNGLGTKFKTRLIAGGASDTIINQWWLGTGISSSDVACVWESIVAGSLAASYTRVAGDQGNASLDPAIVGGVAPTYSSGWVFNGSAYLKTGYIATGVISYIVRYSNHDGTNDRYLVGSFNGGATRSAISPKTSSNKRLYLFAGTGAAGTGANAAAGVQALCPNTTTVKGYFAGAEDWSAASSFSGTGVEFYIGGLNTSGSFGSGYTGTIEAVAFYKRQLTPAEVSDLTTKMAALP